MAVDYTGVNHEQTPARVRKLAQHLVDNDPDQLALLDAESQTFYQYVYDNIPQPGTPVVDAGVYDKEVGVDVDFYVGSQDLDIPLTYFYDLSDIVLYGATVTNVPTAATTSLTVTDGAANIADAGFIAGSHTKVALQAYDAESTDKGPVTILDVIFAPAEPTTIAAANGVEESVVSWDEMDGAASYTIWYIDDAVGTETEDVIRATGQSIPGTTPAGTTITGLTASSVCRVTVTATNPGGTSIGGTPDNATIS